MKIAYCGWKIASLGVIIGSLMWGELAVMAVVMPTVTKYPGQIAQNAPSITDYVFTDGEWIIKIKRKGRDLIYDGLNTTEGKGIKITGVRKSGTKSRQVYTWRNKGTLYNVIWQPADPTFARVQVKDGSQVVLDKLLESAVPEN
jgi:hypothetical protein